MAVQHKSKKLVKIALCFSLCFTFFFQTYKATAQKDQLHKKANIDYLTEMSKKKSLSTVELQKVRETMVTLMNEGRANPNYRKIAGCKTALNLQAGLKPLVLNEKLNKMAQEQADYQASIGKATHDHARYKDFGARVEQHLGKNPRYGAPEACGGSMNLEEWPMTWMQSETHYREVWNLGAFPTTAVGIGVKKDPKYGFWYLTAVWSNFGEEVATTPPANTNNAKTNTVKAPRTELKAGETLEPGVGIFSQNGKYVLIMENSVPSGRYGLFSTFPTNNFSTNRTSTEPKTSLGKVTNKAQKLAMQQDGNLATYDYKNGAYIWDAQTHKKTRDPKTKAEKLIVENDGSISLYNSTGQRLWNHNKK